MKPRVLVTRSPHQASELADALRALGAEPILIPTIEIAEPTTFAPLDAALTSLARAVEQGGPHWLIFTSANAVETFHRRLEHSDSLAARASSPSMKGMRCNAKIAAIGPATSRALTAIGLPADLVPPQAVAESLTAALLPHSLQLDGSPTRFLLIRAEEAREHLPENLRAAGAEVTVASAYRNVIPPGSVDKIQTVFSSRNSSIDIYPDAITFTSSSAVKNLLALLEAARLSLPAPILRASIGPITSATLTELGYPPDVESPEPSVAALAQTVIAMLSLNKLL